MPSANLRLVREVYEAWNRHDLDFLLATTDGEWVFDVHATVPGMKEVYRGKEGLRELFNDWFIEPWEEPLVMDVVELRELDDGRVLALLTFRGVGRHSGIEVTQPYAHVHEIRDGRAVRTEGFVRWRDALEHCGLDPSPADRHRPPARDSS